MSTARRDWATRSSWTSPNTERSPVAPLWFVVALTSTTVPAGGTEPSSSRQRRASVGSRDRPQPGESGPAAGREPLVVLGFDQGSDPNLDRAWCTAGIIGPMTERGLPSADGSPACPFVAFEDDRDARADRPDHRHRCFAEAAPAPRALAHQEAYCLSSAFPVCPRSRIGHVGKRRTPCRALSRTKRERNRRPRSAPPRSGRPWGTRRTRPRMTCGASPSPNHPSRSGRVAIPRAIGRRHHRRRGPVGRRRHRRRAWPQRPAVGHATSRRASSDRPTRAGSGRQRGRPTGPRRGARRGMGASPAYSRATGCDREPGIARRSGSGRAGLPGGPQAEVAESHVDVRPPAKAGRRPTVSSTRDRSRERERDRERAAVAPASHQEGPSWEKVRRNEAYPSIKTRAGLSGLSGIPTIGVLAGGVLLAAFILFLLPGVLGVGGRDGGAVAPSASPSSAVEESPSLSPTPVPKPTPQLYTIKAGDTLSRIARQFNVSLDALLAANKDTIKNPNRSGSGTRSSSPCPRPKKSPPKRRPPPDGGAARLGYRGAMLIAVMRPASTRNVASMCWVGAPGRTTRRSAS